MNCEAAQIACERRRVGALPLDEHEALEAHLAQCVECTAYLATAGVLRDSLAVTEPRTKVRSRRGVWGPRAEMVGVVVVVLIGLAALIPLAASVEAMLITLVLTVGGAVVLQRRRDRRELETLVALATTPGELLFAHRANLLRTQRELHDAASLMFGGAVVMAGLCVVTTSVLQLSAALIAVTCAASALYSRRWVEPRLQAELDDLVSS